MNGGKGSIGRMVGQLVWTLRQQVIDAGRAVQRIFGHAYDSLKKIPQPILPSTLLADSTETLVIVGPRGFKERREVEGGVGRILRSMRKSVINRRPTRPLPSRKWCRASNW